MGITYLDITRSRPIHPDPFMHIYILEKIYKLIKTIHKSSSHNSLIYKILHVKSIFFFKKVFQSYSPTFSTPAVPDEGQSLVHNLHLKGGPTTE